MRSEQQLEIAGPAGNMEARWHEESDPQASMVLCHPHPQMGGSMHDAVLGLLETAAASQRVSCLRFNFRGVGRSEGEYDGQAEWQDVVAAYQYLPESEPRLLAGYSFGGAMAVRAAREVEHLQGLILVAPALGKVEQIHWPACPILVLVGDQDQWIALEHIERQVGSAARLHVVSGADHLFRGCGEEVVRLTESFIGAEIEGWN